jgi:deoxyribodipyrimidine photo-lyase
MNFVYYNPNYDKFNSIPKWAHDTLLKHQSDRNEHIYSRKELEIAETRDAYWNACQNEMVHKGEMHGYLRMYWGKKILKWALIHWRLNRPLYISTNCMS